MTVSIVGMDELQKELRRLSTTQLEKPSKVIAEGMVTSTKKRFEDQKDPDGQAWAPLAPSTIHKRLGGKKAYKKNGQMKAAAARRAANMKILIVSADLMNSIQWRVKGGEIRWGTNKPYARLQNFGSAPEHKSNVPARTFMGINRDDQQLIEKTITRFLEGTL